jgi:hypothetical protein
VENASFRSIDGRCDTNINEKFLVSGREDAMYRDDFYDSTVVQTNISIVHIKFKQTKSRIFSEIPSLKKLAILWSLNPLGDESID